MARGPSRNAVRIYIYVIAACTGIAIWGISQKIARALPEAIAWIPNLLGASFLVAIALFIVQMAREEVRRAIHLAPEPIDPIPRAASVFDAEAIPETEANLPCLKGEWLSMGEDHDCLKLYAHQLDENRSRASAVLHQAVEKFTSDRSILLHQQLQILRHAYRARLILAQIKGLPEQALSVERLPNYAMLVVPPAPAYITEAQLARRYPLLPGGVGWQIGHLLANPANGNLIAAAVVTAVAVINAKATLSKALRQLEITRGEQIRYYVDVRGTLTTLGRAHEEIAASSDRLKAAEQEIRDLVTSAKASLPSGATEIAALETDVREKVNLLWQWIVCADAVHARAAV